MIPRKGSENKRIVTKLEAILFLHIRAKRLETVSRETAFSTLRTFLRFALNFCLHCPRYIQEGDDRLKTVLWISRHEMTAAQLADLERVMGGPVRLMPWRDTVYSLASLTPLLAECDAVATVLPPELLRELLRIAGRKPALRAVSGRRPTGRTSILPDGRQEPEFAFVHQGWEQILRMEITVRRL